MNTYRPSIRQTSRSKLQEQQKQQKMVHQKQHISSAKIAPSYDESIMKTIFKKIADIEKYIVLINGKIRVLEDASEYTFDVPIIGYNISNHEVYPQVAFMDSDIDTYTPTTDRVFGDKIEKYSKIIIKIGKNTYMSNRQFNTNDVEYANYPKLYSYLLHSLVEILTQREF
jgi:hypothetical protein